MRKMFLRLLVTLAIVAVLAYLADFAQWRMRVARGGGMGSVAVDQYLATALKGNKAEYDYLGTVQQPCASALFPHGGVPACWWLRRHTSQWE